MPSKSPRWQALVLFLLTAWLYASILFHLVLQWVGPHSDPNFQHGIFVPIFSLFVLWQDRDRLKAIAKNPSWAGFPLVILSLAILIIGVLGADIFLPRVSFLILLAGLVILFLGWAFFRAVLFPWAVLTLMVPIPTLLINRVTFPLQLLSSKLSSLLLETVGVPLLREGNLIQLASMPLDIAEACSGIRSLLTLLTLAIIYGYLMETRVWARVLLALSALPIAVAANTFRIFGTGVLVQMGYPELAKGFYHQLGGILIFAVALIMLFAVHHLISLISKPDPSVKRSGSMDYDSTREISKPAGSFRFAIVALPMLATAIGMQAHSTTEIIPPAAPPNSLSNQIGDWRGADGVIDEETLDILGHPEYVIRDYENASQPQPWINLYVVYFPSQKAGDTIHSPDHCLPGAGWIPTSREIIRLTRPDGSSFPANRYVVVKGADRQLVLYWFQAHGRGLASEWLAKYYLISDSIHRNRSDGGLVRLMTPMLPDESIQAAQARIMQGIGNPILPLLDQVIPR